MVPSLTEVDPDDVFSSVPYEKGFNLLYELQLAFGEDKMLVFVKKYINTFKWKTITAGQFRDFVVEEFLEKDGDQHFSPEKKAELLKKFDRDAELAENFWLKRYFTAGMPEVDPEFSCDPIKDAKKMGRDLLENAEGAEAKVEKEWGGMRKKFH
jgi:aminopeptidase N